MRAAVVLTLMALLSLDVMPCGRSPRPPPPNIAAVGEACGYGVNAHCDDKLTCCGSDPKTQKTGTCVKVSGLANQGEACGVTNKRCCAEPLSCKITEEAKGDGICGK